MAEEDDARGPGRLTRREFAARAGQAALLVSTGAGAPVLPAAAATTAPARRALFTPRQLAALRALADALVPAADGMASAGEAGAVPYLEALAGRERAVARDLRDALAEAERQARRNHGLASDRLDPRQRAATLAAMEKEAPERFRPLRDLVYEAYYTQPQVWAALGYTFVGPDQQGPPLEPFEEALLERVRALPRLFRETP